MPTYAVLGATGSTGQALLHLLLQSPKNTVHAYARSKAKLLKLSPQYTGNDNLQIFEGALTDVSVIANCISNVTAVLCVLGANESAPGLHVAQDAAQSIVAACCHLKAQDPSVSLPKLLFLASATINPHLCRELPAPVHWLLKASFYYVYEDLEYAQAYLELHKSWLNVTFIQPGGLVHDIQRGHAISLERQQTFLSYLDLAAGFIEVANAGEDLYKWKAVSVIPTSNGTKIEYRSFKSTSNIVKTRTLPVGAHHVPDAGFVSTFSNVLTIIAPSAVASNTLAGFYLRVLAKAIFEADSGSPEENSIFYTEGPLALIFVADSWGKTIPWDFIIKFTIGMVNWTERGFLATYDQGYWTVGGTLGVYAGLRVEGI
ncbi:MAG: hypothetical protein Q9195_008480 [Heterodermia aff. obscurata]